MKANDFDRKMLLLATNVAKEARSGSLLHSILENLLETLKNDQEVDLCTQGLPLIRSVFLLELELESYRSPRCLIRLVLQMTEEPGANP